MSRWAGSPATVVFVSRVASDTLVGLRLSPGVAPPLAPAWLILDDEPVIHLDAVVAVDDPVTVFRTEEEPALELPGRSVALQQWWTPDAFAAVADVSRTWVWKESTRHEHCLLDWTTIEANGCEIHGWCSESDWLCARCYDRYILEDHLRIRGEG